MKNVKNIQGSGTNRGYQFSFFILLIVLLFSSAEMRAQDLKVPSVNSPTVNAGSLLTQFMGAIKPSSFIDQWASGGKSNWLSSVSKIASTPGMVEGVTSLTKYIKPSMFKDAFKPANLLQTATKAKSMADATGLLKSLNGGLKPEAMVSSWAGKESSWLSALNLLK